MTRSDKEIEEELRRLENLEKELKQRGFKYNPFTVGRISKSKWVLEGPPRYSFKELKKIESWFKEMWKNDDEGGIWADKICHFTNDNHFFWKERCGKYFDAGNVKIVKFLKEKPKLVKKILEEKDG